MSLVNYGNSSGSDDELTNSSISRKPRDIRNILSVLPAPKRRKNDQPVRIGFPSLSGQASESDSDSDDGEPSLRQKKTGGLTALLPKPKNVQCSKIVSKTVPSTTHTMVPYTLTQRAKAVAATRAKKRQPPTSSSKVVTKATSIGEDSDSDDGEPVSFFSHLESDDSAVAITSSESRVNLPSSRVNPRVDPPSSRVNPRVDPPSSRVNPRVDPPSSRVDPSVEAPLLGVEALSVLKPPTSSGVNPRVDPPPPTSSGVDPRVDPPPPTSSGVDPRVDPPPPTSSGVEAAPTAPKPFYLGEGGDPYYNDPSLSGWGVQDDGISDECYTETIQSSEGPLLGAGPGLSMDETVYRKFMGGKRRRGRDQGLNDLIEIKEDDVKVEMDTYRKHFSEEAIDKLYKPPSGDKPSAQQKRKHQLTYLAHQAKANELQLLKQWGQSAATKRGTQMKYGF